MNLIMEFMFPFPLILSFSKCSSPQVSMMEIMGDVLTRLGLEGVPGRVLGWVGACRPVSRLRAETVRADPPEVGAVLEVCWDG